MSDNNIEVQGVINEMIQQIEVENIDFIKGEEKSLNQLLIDNGHAAEYDGGKKRVFGNK